MIPLSLCPPATSRAWPQLHQEEVARRQWAGEPHRWCFLPWALTCRQLLPIQRVAQWDGRRYPRYHLTPCHPLIKHHLHPHTWLIPPSDCVCSPHFPPRFSCCHWWCGYKPPPNPPPHPFTALVAQPVLVETSEAAPKQNLTWWLICILIINV